MSKVSELCKEHIEDDAIIKACLADQRVLDADDIALEACEFEDIEDGVKLREIGWKLAQHICTLYGLLAEIDPARLRIDSRTDTKMSGNFVALRKAVNKVSGRQFSEEDAKASARNAHRDSRNVLASLDAARRLLELKIKSLDKLSYQVDATLRSLTAEVKSFRG